MKEFPVSSSNKELRKVSVGFPPSGTTGFLTSIGVSLGFHENGGTVRTIACVGVVIVPSFVMPFPHITLFPSWRQKERETPERKWPGGGMACHTGKGPKRPEYSSEKQDKMVIPSCDALTHVVPHASKREGSLHLRKPERRQKVRL